MGPGRGFWSSPCTGHSKRALLAALLACFLGQSYLVYSDPEARTRLSPRAEAGRRLWQEKNCNACHQLYGFGGFLGPDLTNAIDRLTPERLRAVLTRGSGAMPAFGLDEAAIADLTAFLREIDATGRGQLRSVREGPSLGERVAAEAPPPAQAGWRLFERRCLGCHVVSGPSPVGAPDLSRHALAPAALDEVLRSGRPPRMPAPGLTAEERGAVAAFLAWLRGARDSLERRRVGRLPWWEYR